MPCKICNVYCDKRQICWFCIDDNMMYASEAMYSYGFSKDDLLLNNLFCLEVPNPHKIEQKSHKYIISELESLFKK